jgi:hypothetical protein
MDLLKPVFGCRIRQELHGFGEVVDKRMLDYLKITCMHEDTINRCKLPVGVRACT